MDPEHCSVRFRIQGAKNADPDLVQALLSTKMIFFLCLPVRYLEDEGIKEMGTSTTYAGKNFFGTLEIRFIVTVLFSIWSGSCCTFFPWPQ